MRFVFPIVIVAAFSGISCGAVLDLALHNPDEYAAHLSHAHVGISSFGGAFLFMLFFEFMFDREKTLHWISPLEKPLHRLGRFKIAPTVLTLAALCAVQFFIPSKSRCRFLRALRASRRIWQSTGPAASSKKWRRKSTRLRSNTRGLRRSYTSN